MNLRLKASPLTVVSQMTRRPAESAVLGEDLTLQLTVNPQEDADKEEWRNSRLLVTWGMEWHGSLQGVGRESIPLAESNFSTGLVLKNPITLPAQSGGDRVTFGVNVKWMEKGSQEVPSDMAWWDRKEAEPNNDLVVKKILPLLANMKVVESTVTRLKGGTSIFGQPTVAKAAVVLRNYQGPLAVEWMRSSDGARPGGIWSTVIPPPDQWAGFAGKNRFATLIKAGEGKAPLLRLALRQEFPDDPPPEQRTQEDTVTLIVGDGGDLNVRHSIDFEWKEEEEADEFNFFQFADEAGKKNRNSYYTGETAVITSQWNLLPGSGTARDIAYYANGKKFAEEKGIEVIPGEELEHTAKLALHGRKPRSEVKLRAVLLNPKTGTSASGTESLEIMEGRDAIERIWITSTQPIPGYPKYFWRGYPLSISVDIRAAPDREGPRRVEIAGLTRPKIIFQTSLKGQQGVTLTSNLNTSTLPLGRNSFGVKLFYKKKRQDGKRDKFVLVDVPPPPVPKQEESAQEQVGGGEEGIGTGTDCEPLIAPLRADIKGQVDEMEALTQQEEALVSQGYKWEVAQDRVLGTGNPPPVIAAATGRLLGWTIQMASLPAECKDKIRPYVDKLQERLNQLQVRTGNVRKLGNENLKKKQYQMAPPPKPPWIKGSNGPGQERNQSTFKAQRACGCYNAGFDEWESNKRIWTSAYATPAYVPSSLTECRSMRYHNSHGDEKNYSSFWEYGWRHSKSAYYYGSHDTKSGWAVGNSGKRSKYSCSKVIKYVK